MDEETKRARWVSNSLGIQGRATLRTLGGPGLQPRDAQSKVAFSQFFSASFMKLRGTVVQCAPREGRSGVVVKMTTSSDKKGGKVKVGDKSPEFTLRSQSDDLVSLKDLVGNKEIVLFFYPKDNTSGCTAEACAFRDSYEVFKERGAEVVGVSSDSIASHKDFASRNGLPFILLSDDGGEVRKLYGASSTFGLLPGRVTYIIDKRGIVRHIFSSQLSPKRHIDEALETLEKIQEAERETDQQRPATA